MRSQAAIAARRAIGMRIVGYRIVALRVRVCMDRAVGRQQRLKPVLCRHGLRNRGRDRCHQDCEQSEQTADLPEAEAQHAGQ